MNWISWLVLACFPQAMADDDGVFARALWFLQTHGKVSCSEAKNDQLIKSVLAQALANDGQLSFAEVTEFVDKDVFRRFANDDQLLSDADLASALEVAIPSTRLKLFAPLNQHAAWLTTTFDSIEPSRYKPISQLSDWIVDRSAADQPVSILTTCTGNSRRSILSAQMGNLAAAYYGFEHVRFYSGGTAPTAFNSRTISTLKAIGFRIEPMGKEAKRGEAKLANPIFEIAWGEGLKELEFSKMYQDGLNPQSGFAAVMVCSEADESCPQVTGADLRVSLTFLDPKVFDESRFETFKYAERRDDIGRIFLAVMANARRKLQAKTVPNRKAAHQNEDRVDFKSPSCP